MQTLDGRLVHSASDLNAYTECLHLVALERGVAAGVRERPQRDDPTAQLLAHKGDAHERRHLERLRARYGNTLVAFEGRPASTRAGYEAAERESVAAMERGAAVIYQPTFFDGTFLGRADFLVRVERPSRRWAWSYEVVDTKLALLPKPYFLVQLCNYSEHVQRIQGTAPERASIVLGTGEERPFRVADYAAYYRRLKATYLASFARDEDAYPFECAHCDLCAWRDRCAARRDADDHLSLVAGMRRDQLRKLEEAGIASMHALAVATDAARPRRMSVQTFANVRAQAREQHAYRAGRDRSGAGTHSYTFRPEQGDKVGFARLPEPATGDIFFDMEGDPLYRADRGLEYLFGMYLHDEKRYVPFWGTSPAQERTAFEAFVDFVVARQLRYPNLHVYHYAPYEMSALKRLAGYFGSRENEIDAFLRAGTFVDLYPIVRQSVWISQPSYSIKKVEALYEFSRETFTKGGDVSIVMFESWLETGDAAVLEDIRAYNEDDCRSTFELREWLVRLRAERQAVLGDPTPWRLSTVAPEPAPPIERTELEETLLTGLTPPDSLQDLRRWPEERRGRWLLSTLLQYHRREQKPEWWEHFARLDNPSELVDDRKALGGLTYCADVEPVQRKGERSFVHEYAYPEQEHDIGKSPLDAATGKSAGTVVAIDELTRRLRIKLSGNVQPPPALRALVPAKPRDIEHKTAALESIARAYVDGVLDATHPATLDLLLARHPRLSDRARGATVQPSPVTAAAVSAIVGALDGGCLVVQGPPGSGKSTAGAHVIVDLLAAGKRVALAALSHKALHNLARKVEQTARSRGVVFNGCHKSSDTTEGSAYVSTDASPLIFDAPKNSAFAACALVSATTYEWANADHAGTFDVVVVDEAGQISLADALATSLVARNVVLLGDPQQLPHVSKGSHPPGVDQSILEHLLGGNATIPSDRGVFLDTTYRLHPAIARFVSDAFYDGRLAADRPNARNAIVLGDQVCAGPYLIEVAHAFNARRSKEEAHSVADAVSALLDDGRVVHRDEPERALRASDVLVVTPYNAQRVEIAERLRERGRPNVGVGTVDKFQGQEAAIVFFSLATSSADLAPRGLEFLLSPNRLNVAVSRAQARSVVLCTPQLLASRATTIEAMRLLNLLCAYAEAAASAPVQALVSA